MDQLLKVGQSISRTVKGFRGRRRGGGLTKSSLLGRKVEVNDATVRVQSKKSNHNLCTGLTGLPPGHQMNKQGKNKLIIPQNINIMVRFY